MDEGLLGYRRLVDAGADLILNNIGLAAAIEDGAVAVAWTTSGMVQALAFGQPRQFVAPGGGLRSFRRSRGPWPARTGSTTPWCGSSAGSGRAPERHAGMDRRSGSPELLRLGPSIRDMGYPPGLDIADLDHLGDAARPVDRAAYVEVADSVSARLIGIVGS